jgi:serine/threonine protein kinase
MLLSGSPPFYGKSVEDVYNAILTKEATFADKKFKHVSASCMDFMKRLLTRDTRYRMTTFEALQHPFITGAAFFPRYNGLGHTPSMNTMDIVDPAAIPTLTSSQITQILEAMVNYARLDSLTRLIINMLTHSVGPREVYNTHNI